MEENPNPENENKIPDYTNLVEVDPTKIHIEKNPGTVITNFFQFLKSTLSIKDSSINYGKVVSETKEAVEFKGYNVWILIFSIIIASVGLNVDSTAVIIGAMLISPLMGPIKGIGFGVGTNYFSLIKLSLKNFGITLGVSLATSFAYFLVTPIDQPTDQLFLRTTPTFLDVIIAFTGGLAGVIAAVKGKNDTVVPGVAIATALMPPLCTAGYGLAHWDMHYFLGAFYLFLINSVMIALATGIIVRYFHFPKREFVDAKIEKRVKNYIVIFMVVILMPSAYLFYGMIKNSIFENNASEFYEKIVLNSVKGIATPTYHYDSDSSYIDIDVKGGFVSDELLENWNKQKKEYDLENTFLNVYQGSDISAIENKLDQLEENGVYTKEVVLMLNEKDLKITKLNNELEHQKSINTAKDPLDFNYLLNAFKIDYPEFSSININRSFGINDEGLNDTTYVMFVHFRSDIVSDSLKKSLKSKVSNRFKYELNQKMHVKQDSIPVFNF